MTVGMRLSKAAIRYNQQLQKLRIKMITYIPLEYFRAKAMYSKLAYLPPKTKTLNDLY